MKKVLLASVLKPVTDSRMYEKIGRTLAETEEFEVHIAGSATSVPVTKKIIFHPLYKFPRISTGRIFAQLPFIRLARGIRPDLIIVCTHELLFAAILYKLIFKCQVIYDVQENYFRNILYMTGKSGLFRRALASWVRLKERMLYPYLDACFLAEKIYKEEMPFLKTKGIVLENTFSPPENYEELIKGQKKSSQFPTLIMSGTIAESYGVWEGIDFAANFLEEFEHGVFILCGHVPDLKLLQKLKSLNYPWLILKVSNFPVDHQVILKEIASADLALLPYRPNKATAGKIPTKFFEYMAFRVPMIIQKNPIWEHCLEKYRSSIFVDFQHYNISLVKDQWEKHIFYPEGVRKKIFWYKNGKKLVKSLKSLI